MRDVINEKKILRYFSLNIIYKFYKIIVKYLYCAVSSAAEHLPYKEGVVGSNPAPRIFYCIDKLPGYKLILIYKFAF